MPFGQFYLFTALTVSGQGSWPFRVSLGPVSGGGLVLYFVQEIVHITSPGEFERIFIKVGELPAWCGSVCEHLPLREVRV